MNSNLLESLDNDCKIESHAAEYIENIKGQHAQVSGVFRGNVSQGGSKDVRWFR